MPRICTCCSHPNRSLIDAGIASGVSNRKIADQFHVSQTAVFRHRKHVSAAIKQAGDLAASLTIGTITEQLVDLRNRIDRSMARADKAEDFRAVASLARETRGTLQSLIDLIGAQQLGVLKRE